MTTTGGVLLRPLSVTIGRALVPLGFPPSPRSPRERGRTLSVAPEILLAWASGTLEGLGGPGVIRASHRSSEDQGQENWKL